MLCAMTSHHQQRTAMAALNKYADRELARQADELQRLARARLDLWGREEAPRLSLSRLVLDMSTPGKGDSENRAALKDYAASMNLPFDPTSPYVPFAAFRDLTKADAGA